VDYSIPKVDYSKGPHGEKIVQSQGNYDESNNQWTPFKGSLDGGNAIVHGYEVGENGFFFHGLATAWFDKPKQGFTGKKHMEGNFFSGKANGVMRKWSKDGTLVAEYFQKDDALHGTKCL
jgi:hypothetical protein